MTDQTKAPDRIWAWEVNCPISKDHGSKRWFPWKPKPMTLEMREGFFLRKKVELPQVFTEYIRKDITAEQVREAREATPIALADTPRAWTDVLDERKRQVAVEEWTSDHDDFHNDNELVKAALNYLGGVVFRAKGQDPVTQQAGEGVFTGWWKWPWSSHWWKPTDRRRDLVKAGALILAEIERLDRAALREKP